jgi:catechol 2,3-dioxygenase-like lactoylglutathione lyase family enzyme
MPDTTISDTFVWPKHLPVQRARIARPTNHFEAMVAFYCQLLGLPQMHRFDDHDGYSGVMVGLSDERYHLELVTHHDGIDTQTPNREDLLVFYIDDQVAINALIARLISQGFRPVEPKNPYWQLGGVSFVDPDGWGVVFMNMTEWQRSLAKRTL